LDASNTLKTLRWHTRSLFDSFPHDLDKRTWRRFSFILTPLDARGQFAGQPGVPPHVTVQFQWQMHPSESHTASWNKVLFLGCTAIGQDKFRYEFVSCYFCEGRADLCVNGTQLPTTIVFFGNSPARFVGFGRVPFADPCPLSGDAEAVEKLVATL
jgi:hypothetical protein